MNPGDFGCPTPHSVIRYAQRQKRRRPQHAGKQETGGWEDGGR